MSRCFGSARNTSGYVHEETKNSSGYSQTSGKHSSMGFYSSLNNSSGDFHRPAKTSTVDGSGLSGMWAFLGGGPPASRGRCSAHTECKRGELAIRRQTNKKMHSFGTGFPNWSCYLKAGLFKKKSQKNGRLSGPKVPAGGPLR